jgi:hypothetical protein
MHVGPWEILAYGALWIGGFILAADVGLRMSPNIRLPDLPVATLRCINVAFGTRIGGGIAFLVLLPISRRS